MPTPDPIAPDPDVMAAELALGLLEGDDRAAALRRQLAEPAFAREVQHWRDHFATLFAASAERVPPTGVVERIEADLDRPLAVPVRQSPGFWRPLAMASSLAAATLAGVVALRPPVTSVTAPAAPAASAQMVAAMALSDGKAAPFAAYYDAAHQLVRMPAPMAIPAGRSAQLWAIRGTDAPIPLGLFHVVGNTVVATARTTKSIPAGTILAISFEPLGGSPTGQPTGPVIATGALSSV